MHRAQFLSFICLGNYKAAVLTLLFLPEKFCPPMAITKQAHEINKNYLPVSPMSEQSVCRKAQTSASTLYDDAM